MNRGVARAATLRAVTVAAVAAVAAASFLTAGMAPAGAAPLSITVVGNHLVDGAGQTVQLVGVDAVSTEWRCTFDGDYAEPGLVASAPQIAAWHANAVRVPLNEGCWLGTGDTLSPGLTATGYRAAIVSWVDSLNAAGLYAILDLHYSAPGNDVADNQQPMPDGNSTAFWTSVATTFASDPAVLFDAFNEPDDGAWPDDSSADWNCWLNGGCSVTYDQYGPSPSATYTAVGMQALVDAIRGVDGDPATGATQPILLGGLDYANDLGAWQAHEPADPDHQLVASFHNYWFGGTGSGGCDDTACWNAVIAPLAAAVPVVTGEFDEGYDCADPGTLSSGLLAFDDTYMDWADSAGVGYLAWGWYVPTPAAFPSCSSSQVAEEGGAADAYSLVTDFGGTPAAPDGVNLQAHLAARSVTAPAVTALSPASGPGAGGTKVTITGALLRGTTAVSFGADASASYRVNAAGTVLTATTPAEPAGAVAVTVTTPGGSATAPDDFTFLGPSVTKVTPAAGPVTGGNTVVVHGDDLTGASAPVFGSTPATTFTVNAAGSSITATAPPAAGPGTVPLSVTTAGGAAAATYDYQEPALTKVMPASGPAAGGTKVNLVGQALQGAAAVLFDGTAAASFTVNATGTSIAASPPPHPAGAVTVTVLVDGADLTGTYTYLGPRVTAVSPSSGPATGGTVVTVDGADLQGAAAVDFGGSPATDVVVDAAGTSLTARAPAGTGVVAVVVTTPGGTSPGTVRTADRFTYTG